MEEKQAPNSINFEIAKELNRNNKASIRKLIKPFESTPVPSLFDATQQNILVASFMLTHNPNRFLEETDRSKVSIREIVSSIDKNKSQPQNAARFYLAYNWLYFSKYLTANIRLIESLHFNFRLALNSVTLPPTFPIMKYFLSKMNHLFNFGNKLRFFVHIEEIHRLMDYAADYKTLKSKPSAEPQFQLSCIYGCKIYRLTDLDQRNFCSEEVEAAGLILLSLTHWLGMNPNNLMQCVADLKTKSDALLGLSNDKLTGEKKVTLEESVRNKLFTHLEGVNYFLTSLEQLRNDKLSTVDQIVGSKAYLRSKRLREKYYLAVMNLLAISNFKQKNLTTANLLLTRLSTTCIEMSRSAPEKLDRFEGLSKFNNSFLLAPLLFNTLISHFSVQNFRGVISLSELLWIPFSNCPRFWYYVGVSHFKLLMDETDAVVRKERAETSRTLRETVKSLDKRNITLLVSPLQNCERAVQAYCISAMNAFDPENSNKRIFLAIRCLENSLKLIQNLTNKEHLTSVFQSTGQRYKDYFNGVKDLIATDTTKLLPSVLEHLTYMYLLTNKPMHALKILSIATLQASSLTAAQNSRFAVYHLRAAMMLRKPSALKTSMSEVDRCLNSSGMTPIAVKHFSSTSELVMPAAFLLKYNKLLTFAKDRESAKQTLYGLAEDFLSLTEEQKTACEFHLRNAFFYFFSKHEFSRESLKYVSGNQFDVSKFVNSKNGKGSSI